MTWGGRRTVAGVAAAALVVLGAVAWLAMSILTSDGGQDTTSAAPVKAGGEAIPGAGEEFDGCRFIQRWDAHEILRGSVRPAEKPTDSPAAATCAWEVHDPENPRSLQLSVFRGEDLYDPEAFEDDETFEAVAGIGDDAFLVEPSGVQLHVRAGGYSVLLSVEGFDGDAMDRQTVTDQLVGLAGRVVAGL